MVTRKRAKTTASQAELLPKHGHKVLVTSEGQTFEAYAHVDRSGVLSWSIGPDSSLALQSDTWSYFDKALTSQKLPTLAEPKELHAWEDPLDEWSNWRGKLVQRKHYTYGKLGKWDPITYLVVGGNAADFIKARCKDHLSAKEAPQWLVLAPITRDTDEDSFVLARREDLREVK